jgi:hypothetical protein
MPQRAAARTRSGSLVTNGWMGSNRSPQIQPAASARRDGELKLGPRFTYSEN